MAGGPDPPAGRRADRQLARLVGRRGGDRRRRGAAALRVRDGGRLRHHRCRRHPRRGSPCPRRGARPRAGRRARRAPAGPGGKGGPRRARDRERRHARAARAAPVRPHREAGWMSRARNRPVTKRRRRRLAIGAAVVCAGIVAGVLLARGTIDRAIQELTLPLKHEDVIRQQAHEKDVDAALIAAVIYSESKFSDRTSSAGARGLMQITPEAANEIERHSGGTTFKLKDLSDPEINIRYGTYLLRELLDRYDGDVVAALAAYNAGPGNVDKWGGSDLSIEGIPFPETRAYVEEVLDKQRAYRDKYPRELGY